MSQIEDKILETKNKILEILEEDNGLKMDDIKRKLKRHEFDVGYVDLDGYLKEMMDIEKIIREEVKEEGKPWYYVYKLNKKPLEKWKQVNDEEKKQKQIMQKG